MTQNNTRRSVGALDLTGTLIAAYVANNSVTASELPSLICCVHAALTDLAKGAAANPPIKTSDQATPAQIRKSVTPAALISFIDGKGYKTLKRHLTGHGLNPRSYRDRYGLPADYPMVASRYAEQRSALAKAIGLGQPRQAVRSASTTSGRRKVRKSPH